MKRFKPLRGGGAAYKEIVVIDNYPYALFNMRATNERGQFHDELHLVPFEATDDIQNTETPTPEAPAATRHPR
jgi:hypothetical protein